MSEKLNQVADSANVPEERIRLEVFNGSAGTLRGDFDKLAEVSIVQLEIVLKAITGTQRKRWHNRIEHL